MPEFHYTAQMYERRFTNAIGFVRYLPAVPTVFVNFFDSGKLELITTCAPTDTCRYWDRMNRSVLK